jgi:hypothetical protein
MIKKLIMDLDNNIKYTVVYDIETLSNCFTYTAIDRDSDKVFKFVIWKEKNELYDLLVHLTNTKGMIGFNNINFDYPVMHYIIKERNKLVQLDGDKIAKLIYKKAQSVISQEYSAVKEEEVIIPQLDLFRIWHYDNKARMTGLKKLEIAMNFPNVQDMPYSHEHIVKTEIELNEILDYNLNDVEATKVFYNKTVDKLELRKGLQTKYGLNCLNYPDSKIGEQLMLKLYCHYTQQSEDEVKRRRTHRRLFKFSECVPDYINFKTPEFNQLLDYIKGIEVTELKESFKYAFEYNNFTFDLGTGGIHGCIKAGVYQSTYTEIILDCDVASLYPSLGITLGLYPEHLGEQFSKIYEEGIVKPRLEAKKNKDMVMADGFKLSANSVYGKSNSEYSFLYDPLYTLKTTLSGQLALCMLSEMLMTRVPNLTMLQINTDGLTVSIPVEHKRLYWNICQEWEAQTKLVLEYVAYSQMIIRDVNNYIAVSEKSGKVKYKGTFKPNHEMIKDGEYHKSLSQGIVSLAIADYFLKGIPVEQTIKESKDIYLFCKTFNATHGWYCETVDSEGNPEKQQKTNRYYISNNGKTFRKLKDERVIEVEAGGTRVTIFNKYYEVPFEEYDINYDYYVNECFKIIHKIDGTEERLEKERKEQREKAKKEKEEENYLKFCVDKIPTLLQYQSYNREWLQEKYGIPTEIRPSKVKNIVNNLHN